MCKYSLSQSASHLSACKILILPDIFSLSDYGLPEMEVALRGMVSFPDQNFLTLPKEPTDSIRELSFLQADKLFV